MFIKKPLILCLLIGISLPSLVIAQENNKAKETIIIRAPRPQLPSINGTDGNNIKNDDAYDAASIIDNVAGASIIKNGTQTGIVQLRGLSQDRVKVVIDGVEINPACPNHMDPPLHYVDPHQIEQVAVIAGVTSVVNGGDSIGGTIIVNTKAPKFSNSNENEINGNIYAKSIGANNGYEASATLGLGLENAAFALSSAKQYGEDIKYKGGVASDTGYEIRSFKLESAIKLAPQVFGLSLGLKQSRNVGTPSLAMDMAVDDSTNIIFNMDGEYSIGKISARIFQNDIDHIMDNYTLRTYTPAASRMKAPATSRDYGFAIGNEIKALGGIIRFGADGHKNIFNVYSQNISNNMRSDLFVNSKRNRIGIYGEIDKNFNAQLRTVFGLRLENIESNSDNINNVMMMTLNPAKNAFNARIKKRIDNNLDISASARYKINTNFNLEFSLAQKTRSPSLVERYIWTPSATYGAADGRNYLGNIDLKPEISKQITGLLDIRISKLRIKQSAFFNRVDDYIQGVAISTDPMSTLQFQNIDAKLYGAETTIDFDVSDNVKLDGNISYVRGENKTHNDNLYRIAPINGNITIHYNLVNFDFAAETEFASKQEKTSKYNNESTSPSWAVLNLKGRYKFGNENYLTFGVDNIFDKYYFDHLSGINRVNNVALGGDLPIGIRVPSPGRYFYFGINYNF